MPVRPRRTAQRAITSLVFLLLPTGLLAADWSSCHDDLDTLRRRASDASDAAEQVYQAADEVETKRRELQDCRAYPAVHDLMRDGCRSQRSDYESARDEFQSAKSNLESELDDVDSAIRSASLACGYSFSNAAGAVGPRVDGMCRLMQRYKGRLPFANLLELCKQSKSETDCKKCLE